MKKLPEFVFVSWKGDDEPFLTASVKAASEIEDDGPTVVGTYKLVETAKLSKRVVSKPAR